MTNYRRTNWKRRIVAAVVSLVAIGGVTVATAAPAEAVNGLRHPATKVNGL